MPDPVRVSLKALNAAQLALVAAAALLIAWASLAAFGTRSTAGTAQGVLHAGARAFAGTVNAELNRSFADARNLALLLRPDDPAPVERSALVETWLALNPRYRDAVLIGPDGRVRAAADPRRLGADVTRQAWFARARHAGVIVATDGDDADAPVDVVVSLASRGQSGWIRLRAGPAYFTEIAEQVRHASGLPDGVVFTVSGADGRALAGAAVPIAHERLSASEPMRGSRTFNSPGWVVMAHAPSAGVLPAAAQDAAADRRLLAVALAVTLAIVLAALALGHWLGGRAVQALRRLGDGSGRAGAEPVSWVSEIAALTEAVAGGTRSAGARIDHAESRLDRIGGRLRAFETMSGWTCCEIDPQTGHVVWSEPGGAGQPAAAENAADLSDLAAWFEPADGPLLHRALAAAREADGPHDVVLRARAEPAAPGRRVLIRFLRAEDRTRVYALSRETDAENPSQEVSDPARDIDERRRDRVLRRVTDGILHDFNDVLTIVLSNLGILRWGRGLDAKQALLVETALAGALRGSALTRRMLSFVRGEVGTLAESDLNAAVATALAFMQTNVLRDIAVINRVPKDLPRVACAERVIEIVLLNLAYHLRDHGWQGLAVAAVEDRPGPDSAKDDPAKAGRAPPPGAPNTHAPNTHAPNTHVRLIVASGRRRPDRRATAASPRTIETVARLLAEAGAGWRLIADGTGEEPFLAEVWLRAAERPATQATPRQASLRILLVESDSLVRTSLAAALAELGHRVVQAGSGEQALAFLEESAEYDTIVVDQSMPVMSGLQLAATVVERYPRIRLVLASPRGLLPTTARAFPHLDKPFRQDDLAALLGRAPYRGQAA